MAEGTPGKKQREAEAGDMNQRDRGKSRGVENQIVRDGKQFTGNLLPPPHFTDEETAAQRGSLIHTALELPAGPALA